MFYNCFVYALHTVCTPCWHNTLGRQARFGRCVASFRTAAATSLFSACLKHPSETPPQASQVNAKMLSGAARQTLNDCFHTALNHEMHMKETCDWAVLAKAWGKRRARTPQECPNTTVGKTVKFFELRCGVCATCCCSLPSKATVLCERLLEDYASTY